MAVPSAHTVNTNTHTQISNMSSKPTSIIEPNTDTPEQTCCFDLCRGGNTDEKKELPRNLLGVFVFFFLFFFAWTHDDGGKRMTHRLQQLTELELQVSNDIQTLLETVCDEITLVERQRVVNGKLEQVLTLRVPSCLSIQHPVLDTREFCWVFSSVYLSL
jgi:hypothetical protein